jgi:hypothetical protein
MRGYRQDQGVLRIADKGAIPIQPAQHCLLVALEKLKGLIVGHDPEDVPGRGLFSCGFKLSDRGVEVLELARLSLVQMLGKVDQVSKVVRVV